MRFLQFIGAGLGLALACAAQAQSFSAGTAQQRQADAPALFNWNYAAIYGTGFYSIGEEKVAVARLPFSRRLLEPTDDQWGLKLTLPVSAAFAQFDLHRLQLGHVNTMGLSFLPGIEAEIRRKDGWILKPFANVGKGWEFNSHTNASIWSLGISAGYHTSFAPRWLAGVGGKLTYAGYRAREQSNVLGAVQAGVETGYITDWELFGRRTIIGAQLTGTFYFNRLEFLLPGTETQGVSNERAIGITLGAAKPFEVYGTSFDRVGVAYRTGANGLKGVEVVASFPF